MPRIDSAVGLFKFYNALIDNLLMVNGWLPAEERNHRLYEDRTTRLEIYLNKEGNENQSEYISKMHIREQFSSRASIGDVCYVIMDGW